MKKIFLNFSFFLLASGILLLSCKTEKKENIITETEEYAEEGDETNVIYRLPSPVDMFMYLKESDGTYDKNFMNPGSKQVNYLTKHSKLLNFGVYASDLVYSTVFGQSQESFQYFKTAKALADELGYTEGFNQILIKRMEQSQFNTDSVYQISMDAYWDACTYLEDQGKTDELTLIIAGGWLESIYIALKTNKTFAPNDPIVQRIAEQYMPLDNLLSLFKQQELGDQGKIVFEILYDINQDLLTMNENNQKNLNETNFKAFKEKIENIRKEITN